MVNNVFLSSLVPNMYKSEFDNRAADFLSLYCKEALENPMPVPIEYIARDQLHLTILEAHLSSELRNQEKYHRPRVRPLSVPQKILCHCKQARQPADCGRPKASWDW